MIDFLREFGRLGMCIQEVALETIEGFDAEHHADFAGMFSNLTHTVDTPVPLVLRWANAEK